MSVASFFHFTSMPYPSFLPPEQLCCSFPVNYRFVAPPSMVCPSMWTASLLVFLWGLLVCWLLPLGSAILSVLLSVHGLSLPLPCPFLFLPSLPLLFLFPVGEMLAAPSAAAPPFGSLCRPAGGECGNRVMRLPGCWYCSLV